MMNVDKCILFDINLESDNFEVYKFKTSEKLLLCPILDIYSNDKNDKKERFHSRVSTVIRKTI